MIQKALKPLTDLVSGGKRKGTTKRTARYRVVVKGVTISKHSTKRLAQAKAKGVRGARVLAVGRRRK